MRAVVGLAVLMLAGCLDDDDGDACIDVDTECTPAYDPTWDEVYAQTLVPSCGGQGVSCHAPEGNQGGWSVTDAAGTWDSLLGGEYPYVVPGEPGCGPLVKRLETEDPGLVMPIGDRLEDDVRCAIRQWIANGAGR